MTPAEFRAAIAAYRLDGEAAPPLPRSSLVVGHGHGHRAEREPALFYALAHALDARALAFEWSHDQLGPLIDGLRETGTLDVAALWRLPRDAEAFCGDGRFTAGHVALLERLHAEQRLAQVILFDRLAWTNPERSEQMAAQLARDWNRAHRLLAVVGNAHVPTFERHLPDVQTIVLDSEPNGTAVVPER